MRSSYLKFYPRLNLYKSSTGSLVYNPVTRIATSYRWYEIFKVINGIKCLNVHSYSTTTAKHVSKLRCFLNPWRNDTFYFEAPRGLQDLNYAIEYYNRKIVTLKNKMMMPRTHKAKNEERSIEIENHQETIKRIESLMGKKELPFFKLI